MRKIVFGVLVIALFITGCIGELHLTSPVPRTMIRTGANSYLEVVPKEAHIEWATEWPFSYPYGNKSKGRRQ